MILSLMRKVAYILIFVTLGLTVQAETPNELAIKIIKRQSNFGYNVRDNSNEELVRAHAINSAMSLNWLMVNDKNVSEELRICYAIKLLNDALGVQKVVRSGSKPLTKEELMMKQRLILAARLVKIGQAESDR